LVIKYELPDPFLEIMPYDILGLVISNDLKIPMVRCKPSIDHSDNLYFSFSQPDPARGFFATVSGVAFYLED
jgi:hypothetical protein